ncbi:hypothetical protein ACFYQA_01020 [Streptomyces sp. NPDC005774]
MPSAPHNRSTLLQEVARGLVDALPGLLTTWAEEGAERGAG